MKIGITTSLPVEILYAADHIPVDLNNIFINGDAENYIRIAEYAGYPRNICAWIKGLYGVVIKKNIETVIGVTEGDCSNTHSLMSTLMDQGVSVINFAFPHNRDYQQLKSEMQNLENSLGANHDKVLEVKKSFDEIRRKLIELDKLTYKENKVTGQENHVWLVNSSDFEGDPLSYTERLDSFLIEAEKRNPLQYRFRLAFLGVPPIITDLYDFLTGLDSQIVFNEIQRQFSMPYLEKDLVNQYLRYTYPYSIFHRLEDIKVECKKRKIDAVISYSQSFCHRQIDNILIKKYLDIPLLSLEADSPGELDARTKLRIESFIDMLKYS